MQKPIIILISALLIAASSIFSQSKPVATTKSVKSTTGTASTGKTNGSVKIGSQEWMKKNLDVVTFRNGDTILEVKSAREWKLASSKKEPAWCYYEYDKKNAQQYGKSYNWYAVNDKRGLAPGGWMIPSNEDWKTLITFLGGARIAGAKMQVSGGWEPPAENVPNKDGFSVMDGVCYSHTYGVGQWWTSSHRVDDENAYFFSQRNYLGEAETNWGLSNYMVGVRCIKSTEKDIKKVTPKQP